MSESATYHVSIEDAEFASNLLATLRAGTGDVSRADAIRAISITRESATRVERERCDAIVQAARFGEIDRDWRSISFRISSGEAFPPPNASSQT